MRLDYDLPGLFSVLGFESWFSMRGEKLAVEISEGRVL